MVKVIGLTKDLTQDDRNLRSFSYLIKLPEQSFVSHQTLIEIQHQLSKNISESIEIHAPLV